MQDLAALVIFYLMQLFFLLLIEISYVKWCIERNKIREDHFDQLLLQSSSLFKNLHPDYEAYKGALGVEYSEKGYRQAAWVFAILVAVFFAFNLITIPEAERMIINGIGLFLSLYSLYRTRQFVRGFA